MYLVRYRTRTDALTPNRPQKMAETCNLSPRKVDYGSPSGQTRATTCAFAMASPVSFTPISEVGIAVGARHAGHPLLGGAPDRLP